VELLHHPHELSEVVNAQPLSFKYGDPVAIPRPYDSGAMGWAIARDLVSVGHVQDQRLRFRGIALRKIAHGLRTHV